MSNTSVLEKHERQSKFIRGLSDTSSSGMKRERNLFFTSSTSTTMPLVDESPVAYTGLYRCGVRVNSDEEYGTSNVEYDHPRCLNVKKVADGFNRDGNPHVALPLHNLQFHNGNHETKKSHETRIGNPTESRPSYLYANTYVDNKEENPSEQLGSWEILRAKLPNQSEASKNSDGFLQFESLFRTLEAFDWNECDFKCCPYNSNKDDDPFQYSKQEENNYYAHTHAYVRTIPRSFSVDETNGDIFVSWEGFYQNCDPARLVQDEKLQWTIGVSRLRTEDPYCTTDQVHVMENNFARCTEPVSIVHQSSHGHDYSLPYGGLMVVPARDREHRRSFIMSVITSPDVREEHKSFVWAVPEGGSHDQDQLALNIDGVSMGHNFANVWDGGTLRLHKNSQTGRPDHLCRSIFNKGIGCMPISDEQGFDGFLPQGEEKIVLTEEAVASFCNVADGDRDFGERRMYKTPIVTGFEVTWNEKEEDGIGLPEQIIFGCFGGKSSNGNFGIISLEDGEPTRPIQLVKGAFPGAILFPPQDLEKALSQSLPKNATEENDLSGAFQKKSVGFYAQACAIAIAAIALFAIFHFKRRRRWELLNNLDEKRRVHNSKQYMELPSVVFSSSSDTDDENKLSSCEHHFHSC